MAHETGPETAVRPTSNVPDLPLAHGRTVVVETGCAASSICRDRSRPGTGLEHGCWIAETTAMTQLSPMLRVEEQPVLEM